MCSETDQKIVKELKEMRREGYWQRTCLMVILVCVFMLIGPCRQSLQSEPPSLDSSRVDPFVIPSVALGRRM